MSLQYSNTHGVRSVPADAYDTFTEQIKIALVDLGFDADSYDARAYFRFSAQPGDGQTVLVLTTTYTFKNAIANAYDVAIGATAGDTANNFVNAINAGPGAGTAYGNGTLQHAYVQAERTSDIMNVDVKITPRTMEGTVAHSWTIAGTTSPANVKTYSDQVFHNFGEATFLAGGGWLLRTSPTADGLVGSLLVQRYANNDYVTLLAEGSKFTQAPSVEGVRIEVSPSRVYIVRGCAHQFYLFLEGNYGGNEVVAFFTVPKIEEGREPVKIQSLVNVGGEVKLVCQSVHGYLTGNSVYVDAVSIGGSYDNNINGFFANITVVDALSFILDGSVFPAGGHTTGTGVVALNNVQLARAVCCAGANAQISSFRTNPFWGGTSMLGPMGMQCWVNASGFNYSGQSNGSSIGAGIVLPLVSTPDFPSSTTDRNVPVTTVQLYGGAGLIIEPRLYVQQSTTGSYPVILGQLWDTFYATNGVSAGLVKQNLMGRDWVNLMNSSSWGSLWTVT